MFSSLVVVLSAFCLMGVHSTSLPALYLLESPDSDEVKALSMSILRGTWNGNSVSVTSSVGYGGNANFQPGDTSATGNALHLHFKISYPKAPPVCHWQLEGTNNSDTIYMHRVQPETEGVTIYAYDIDGKPVDWSSIDTDFSVLCYGASQMSARSHIAVAADDL